ncbi:hypothetical protein HK101_000457 [Irineochytrium annulatum]|nr:hypothetical protein HK101_000457 [Irineochytrium annulatum]
MTATSAGNLPHPGTLSDAARRPDSLEEVVGGAAGDAFSSDGPSRPSPPSVPDNLQADELETTASTTFVSLPNPETDDDPKPAANGGGLVFTMQEEQVVINTDVPRRAAYPPVVLPPTTPNSATPSASSIPRRSRPHHGLATFILLFLSLSLLVQSIVVRDFAYSSRLELSVSPLGGTRRFTRGEWLVLAAIPILAVPLACICLRAFWWPRRRKAYARRVEELLAVAREAKERARRRRVRRRRIAEQRRRKLEERERRERAENVNGQPLNSRDPESIRVRFRTASQPVKMTNGPMTEEPDAIVVSDDDKDDGLSTDGGDDDEDDDDDDDGGTTIGDGTEDEDAFKEAAAIYEGKKMRGKLAGEAKRAAAEAAKDISPIWHRQHMTLAEARASWKMLWAITGLSFIALAVGFALVVAGIWRIVDEFHLRGWDYGEGLIRCMVVALLCVIAVIALSRDVVSFRKACREISDEENAASEDPFARVHKGPPLDLIAKEDKILALSVVILMALINVASVTFAVLEGWTFREAEQWYIASIAAIGFSLQRTKTDAGKGLLLLFVTFGMIIIGVILTISSQKMINSLRTWLLQGIRKARTRVLERRKRRKERQERKEREAEMRALNTEADHARRDATAARGSSSRGEGSLDTLGRRSAAVLRSFGMPTSGNLAESPIPARNRSDTALSSIFANGNGGVGVIMTHRRSSVQDLRSVSMDGGRAGSTSRHSANSWAESAIPGGFLAVRAAPAQDETRISVGTLADRIDDSYLTVPTTTAVITTTTAAVSIPTAAIPIPLPTAASRITNLMSTPEPLPHTPPSLPRSFLMGIPLWRTETIDSTATTHTNQDQDPSDVGLPVFRTETIDSTTEAARELGYDGEDWDSGNGPDGTLDVAARRELKRELAEARRRIVSGGGGGGGDGAAGGRDRTGMQQRRDVRPLRLGGLWQGGGGMLSPVVERNLPREFPKSPARSEIVPAEASERKGRWKMDLWCGNMWARALKHLHEHTETHTDLLAASVFVILTWLLGSVVLVATEGWTLLNAVYFTFSLMTTTGYGDLYPVTGWGRSWVIVMTFAGLGVWAYALSTVVARVQAMKVGKQARRIRALRKLRMRPGDDAAAGARRVDDGGGGGIGRWARKFSMGSASEAESKPGKVTSGEMVISPLQSSL